MIAGRNDGYGGDFLGRLQNFVSVLIPLLHEISDSSELIIVEWNPPRDRERLIEALRWPRETSRVSVRIIEVPNNLHHELNAGRVEYLDSIARNVGIRRARNAMVLSTNPDILFSEDMVSFFAGIDFDSRWLYRTDRYDVRVPSNMSVGGNDILATARQNIFQVHIKNISMLYDGVNVGTLDKFPTGATLAEGEWGRAVALDGLADDVYWGLHTNASGDFLLTHSDNWSAIRGYAEWFGNVPHLDTVVCFQMKAAGVRQAFVTTKGLLHQDHARSARDYPDIDLVMGNVRDGIVGPAMNRDDWGLGGITLPETILGASVRLLPPATGFGDFQTKQLLPVARCFPWSVGDGLTANPWDSGEGGRSAVNGPIYRDMDKYRREGCFATDYHPIPWGPQEKEHGFIFGIEFLSQKQLRVAWKVELEDREHTVCASFDLDMPVFGLSRIEKQVVASNLVAREVRVVIRPLKIDGAMHLPPCKMDIRPTGEDKPLFISTEEYNGVSGRVDEKPAAVTGLEIPGAHLIMNIEGNDLNKLWETSIEDRTHLQLIRDGLCRLFQPVHPDNHVATKFLQVPEILRNCRAFFLGFTFPTVHKTDYCWRVQLQDDSYRVLVETSVRLPQVIRQEKWVVCNLSVSDFDEKMRLVFYPKYLGGTVLLPWSVTFWAVDK